MQSKGRHRVKQASARTILLSFVTPAFTKIYVYGCPLVNAAFTNISTLESVYEEMCLRRPFFI